MTEAERERERDTKHHKTYFFHVLPRLWDAALEAARRWIAFEPQSLNPRCAEAFAQAGSQEPRCFYQFCMKAFLCVGTLQRNANCCSSSGFKDLNKGQIGHQPWHRPWRPGWSCFALRLSEPGTWCSKTTGTLLPSVSRCWRFHVHWKHFWVTQTTHCDPCPWSC